jgi:ATP-dependent RNA helicase RhlE
MGGTAVSFCDREEIGYLRDIQRLISKKIPVIEDQPYRMSAAGN